MLALGRVSVRSASVLARIAVLVTCNSAMSSWALAADDWATCTIGPISEGVLAACSRVIETGKFDTRQRGIAYRRRGDSHRSAGDIDHAIADYGQAIRLDPNDALAFAKRGGAYIGKNAPELAIRDFSEAIRLDPTLTSAFNDRGLLFTRKGDYTRGIRDFGQAIQLNASDPSPYLNRGLAYVGKREFDRAFADFNEALRLDPNLTEAFRSRAHAHKVKGEFDRAIADLTRAIELDPNNAIVLNDRGLVYIAQGEEVDKIIGQFPAKAKKYLANSIGVIDRGDRSLVYKFEACSGKALLLDEQGDKDNYDHSIEDFSRAIDLDPTYKFPFANRALAYASKCDYQRAISDYNQAIRLDSRNARWRYERGTAKLRNGDQAGGQSDISAAKAMDPNVPK
jgi:tetratricopeptide (TPR) repeat protein